MFFKLTLYLLGWLALGGFLIIFPIDVAFTEFKDYLSILLMVSSMVFTLMGIWIAFLYPNALKRIVDPETVKTADFSSTLSETKRLEGLVLSVLKSGLVVTFVMLIFLAKLLLSSLSFYTSYISYFKSGAVSLVVVLSYVQLESVFHVVYSNVMFLNDLHSKREDRELDDDV